MSRFVVLAALFACTYAQTITWPTNFAPGSTHMQQDGVLDVNMTSTTGGFASGNIGGSYQTLPLTAVSQTSSIIRMTSTITGIAVATCVLLDRYTSTHLRVAWRTPKHATYGVHMNLAFVVSSCSSVSANEVPENEYLFIDTTAANLVPATLPSSLQHNFTYQADPLNNPTCSNNVDGMTTNTQLNLDTTGCTPTTTLFGAGGPLYCLGHHVLGTNNMVWFTDSLSAPRNYYCGSYGASGSLTALTLSSGVCFSTLTATAGGNITLGLAQIAAPTAGSGTGGDASGLIPSLVLIASALFARPLL